MRRTRLLIISRMYASSLLPVPLSFFLLYLLFAENFTIKSVLFTKTSFFILMEFLFKFRINATSFSTLSSLFSFGFFILLNALLMTALKFFVRSSTIHSRFSSLQRSISGVITLYSFCAFSLHSVTCCSRSFDSSLIFPSFTGA